MVIRTLRAETYLQQTAKHYKSVEKTSVQIYGQTVLELLQQGWNTALSVQRIQRLLTKEALEGFRELKYADDLVLQGMNDTLTEVERCYRMDVNVDETKVNENLKRTTHIPITDPARSETASECEIFKPFVQHDNKWRNMYTWN